MSRVGLPKGDAMVGSQLLKVSFTANSNRAKRAYNHGVPGKPASGHSLQGIKVMLVSWLDTTFHITVTNIKSTYETHTRCFSSLIAATLQLKFKYL